MEEKRFHGLVWILSCVHRVGQQRQFFVTEQRWRQRSVTLNGLDPEKRVTRLTRVDTSTLHDDVKMTWHIDKTSNFFIAGDRFKSRTKNTYTYCTAAQKHIYAIYIATPLSDIKQFLLSTDWYTSNWLVFFFSIFYNIRIFSEQILKHRITNNYT